MIGDVFAQFSIFCNTTAYGSNNNITWLKSLNKVNIYVLQNDSRILIINNGQKVEFTNLSLSDQQYYACGVTINNKLVVVNQYFLYVRGKNFELKKNLFILYLSKRLEFFAWSTISN